MKEQNGIDSQLQARLNELKLVPGRDPKAAARGRVQFLAEAFEMEQAVSRKHFLRLNRWIFTTGKENFAMNVFISLLLVAGLFFGGSATVSAAQDDLPGQPLYTVKTLSEEIGLQFQNTPQERVDRLMELAQIRIQEMARLTEAGQTPPDQVRQRLELHLQQAFQTAGGMDDATLDRTLLQLRDRLQTQDRDMERLQIHASIEAQPILERTRAMLQLRLHMVEAGFTNHEQFRHAVRNGMRLGQTETVAPATNQSVPPETQPAGGGYGPGPNTSPDGFNPNATPSPGDGNSHGPGPNPDTGGSSGSRNGNGPGPGPNPDSGGSGSSGNGPGGNRP